MYRENDEHIVHDILTPDFMKAHIEVLMMDIKGNSKTTESHYSHSDKEELAVVMSGELSVDLNGSLYEITEGDVVRIPPNLKHRFINNYDTNASVLFILTPALTR